MLERMAESSRLESLGTLAGGVAHEINTPCQFIGDNLSFVEGWLPRLLDVTREARTASESGDWALTGKMANAVKYDFAAKELPAAINQALGGLERIASIVQAIKTFAYPSTKTMEPFNLNNVVELAATVTRNKWKTVADLNLTLAPDLPFFCGLEGEISQVLVNLIVNAVDAIVEKNPSGSGRIDIATRQKENWIELSVADTGNGISEENNNKIFELFFTTKAPGKGTGQGLAISKAIVLRHGGSIDVESEAGVGTCFHILLPIAGAPVPDPA